MCWKKGLFKSGVMILSLFAGAAVLHAAEKATLTTAPNVPSATARTSPATVVVNFEAKEYVGELADGVKYKFWSFNGTVPGPMVRVRVGDTVEFHLANAKDSEFPHNIDIHAVNGPGGGAAVNLAGPGEKRVFRFKVLNPGLYIYHCASPAPSIPAHIANGMYGLILVEPENQIFVKGAFPTRPQIHKFILRFAYCSKAWMYCERPAPVLTFGLYGILEAGTPVFSIAP